MNFEQALRAELETVADEVYPIVAPEKVVAPFIVFNKESEGYEKTLEGTCEDTEAVYSIYILADDYDVFLSLPEAVKNKLLSFFQRSIGTDGPFIQDVTVNFQPDSYVSEFNLIQSKIRLTVNY